MNYIQFFSRIFLGGLVGFILGVSLRIFVFDDVTVLIYGGFIVAVAGTVAFWKKQKTVIFCCAILLAILGMWRADFVMENMQTSSMSGKSIQALAFVAQEPTRTEYSQRLILQIESCLSDAIPCSREKIVAYGSKWEAYAYGDEVQIQCTLTLPENFSDDFNWRMYLAKDSIYYQCSDERLEKTGSYRGSLLNRYLFSLRNKMESTINSVIPQPEAALGNGLLFGGANRLSDELQDDFSKTSMTHIVAVSGYNVSILSYYFLALGILVGLRRQSAFWVAALGIYFFVAMIGFPSSAIRAGIMGVLMLWAMKQGRLSDSLRALLLAGAVMLAWNPLLFRWDIGFQLSFMATLGIILLAPFWEEARLLKGKTFGLLDILFVTFAAQIFVIPIVLYHFHAFSPISFLANILILGIVPISMLFVFLTAMTGLVWMAAAQIFGWMAYIFLKYEVFVIQFLADYDRWQWVLNDFSVAHVIAWYVMTFGGIVYLRLKRKQKIQGQCQRYENI
jgi:competence protein ComEC